jgi:hypothetical protein
VQNTEILSSTLTIKFKLFTLNLESAPIPMYIFILISFVIGALLSILYFLFEKLRYNAELRKKNNQIRKLENDLSAMEKSPLQENTFASVTPDQAKQQAQGKEQSKTDE